MNKYDLTEIKLRRYAVNVSRLHKIYANMRLGLRQLMLSRGQYASRLAALNRREDEAIRRLARGMFNKTPSEIANFVGYGGIAGFRRY